MKFDLHEQRIQTVCLLVLSAVAGGCALYWLRGVLIPFLLSLFLAIALGPLIDLMVTRLRLNRGVAVVLTLLLGVVFVLLVTGLVSVSVRQMAEKQDLYAQQFHDLIESASESLPLEVIGIDPETGLDSFVESSHEAFGKLLVGSLNSILGLLSQGIVVLIFLLFLLMGRRPRAPDETGTWVQVERSVKLYLLNKFAMSLLTGVIVGGVLAILGIDLALVFGLFAFLLNFIPQVGSMISTLLPLPVVLLTPGMTVATGSLAIGLPIVANFVIGNVIEPRIMGSSLDLHPVTILLALIFWGALWGFVGMLLAAPLTSVLRLLLEKMEVTRPVAELLAGRTIPKTAEA